MKMRFRPDQSVEQLSEDRLGFQAFINTIEDAFRNTSCPFVYGIIGDWGSGKTSVMKILFDRMNTSLAVVKAADQPYVPIWFNAWQYENDTSIVYPLLHTIQKDFTTQIGIPATEEMRKSFMRVAKGSLLALTDLGLRAATHHFVGEALSLDDVKKSLELGEKDERLGAVEVALHKWADEVGELKVAFDEMLKCYADALARKTKDLSADDVRFVIFIDDLDRCLPDTVVRILESIKNFLTARNTIFVLGINPRIVYQGIRSKYPNVDVDGKEYLEKIINYSFYVPEAKVEAAEKFAQALLKELVLVDDSDNDPERAFSEFAKVLSSCRFANPRKIKRILNRYLLFLSTHGVDSPDFSNANTVRFIVVAEYFPSLFSLFLSSAEEVRTELFGVGRKTDLRAFEAKYGVQIGPLYGQITRMKDLFNLETREGLAPLAEHAEAIFAITRV
jgi:hypothetical protein